MQLLFTFQFVCLWGNLTSCSVQDLCCLFPVCVCVHVCVSDRQWRNNVSTLECKFFLFTFAGIGDRSLRLLRLQEMLNGLPRVNFEVLKFLFQHFVR